MNKLVNNFTYMATIGEVKITLGTETLQDLIDLKNAIEINKQKIGVENEN